MLHVFKTDGGIMQVEDAYLEAFAGLDVKYEEVDARTEEAIVELCSDAAALLVVREPITAWVLERLPECRVVTRFGVGLDTVDVEAATAHGVRVTNVPDANIQEVAAHTLAMALSLVRRLPQFDAVVRAGSWGFAEPGRGIRRISSLSLGLVGLGRIGRLVASGACSLGFNVLATDPIASDEEAEACGARLVDLDELLTTSDVVSLHVPLTQGTRRLIDEAALGQMKQGAILVNTSRGGLVDESALASALESGRLSGAGVDAFESEPPDPANPLLKVEHAVFSPHAAHYSHEAHRETTSKAFADAGRVLRGEEPLYPVNDGRSI